MSSLGSLEVGKSESSHTCRSETIILQPYRHMTARSGNRNQYHRYAFAADRTSWKRSTPGVPGVSGCQGQTHGVGKGRRADDAEGYGVSGSYLRDH